MDKLMPPVYRKAIYIRNLNEEDASPATDIIYRKVNKNGISVPLKYRIDAIYPEVDKYGFARHPSDPNLIYEDLYINSTYIYPLYKGSYEWYHVDDSGEFRGFHSLDGPARHIRDICGGVDYEYYIDGDRLTEKHWEELVFRHIFQEFESKC